MSFELAQKVADAVLYEGYVLYPYRASAAKNRVRWQFGVVAPRGGSEPWEMQTECLAEPGSGTEIDLRVRFLQVQARTIEESLDAEGGAFRPVETLEIDNRTLVTWEEGVERRLDETIALAGLLAGERQIPLEIPGGRDEELVRAMDGGIAARIVRERWPVSARVSVAAEPAGELIKLRVRIENVGAWQGGDRGQTLRRSLIGAHTLLAIRDGAFVSLLDPPSTAAAAACMNLHTWPVLIGQEGARDVLLSSPIILYDYPKVAPESPGDLCDSTEIDEILTLRVMTLTEEEKREAMGTDERARRIIERSDAIPPEVFERLHGAVRSFNSPSPVTERGPGGEVSKGMPPGPALADWESFLNPPGAVPPEQASLEIGGVQVAKGSRVRLRPSRRADSMDLFLADRTARVEGVYRDVEDAAYVAVTLEDDPAGDLHNWHGRFYYFYPEEIEPLESGPGQPPDVEERRPHATNSSGHTGAGHRPDPDPVVAGAGPLHADQTDVAARRILIAGVGNIFLGDDGFGVEVANRLSSMAFPKHVRVADFGIRGVHLAYELLEGRYETTILVDATPRGGEPGTVYLLEPDLDPLGDGGPDLADAHGMDPRAVFGLLARLGGTPGRVLIVGCEPARTEEEMGLSEPVASAVDEAVRMILGLLEREELAQVNSDNPSKEENP